MNFNKKNDPLVDAVKNVMRENDIRRAAEKEVNEQFNVYSRKALVHEKLAEYDAALAKRIDEALKKKVITESAFGTAFQDARRSGQKVFTFNGKQYTSRMKDETDDAWNSELSKNSSPPVPAPRPEDRIPAASAQSQNPVNTLGVKPTPVASVAQEPTPNPTSAVADRAAEIRATPKADQIINNTFAALRFQAANDGKTAPPLPTQTLTTLPNPPSNKLGGVVDGSFDAIKKANPQAAINEKVKLRRK